MSSAQRFEDVGAGTGEVVVRGTETEGAEATYVATICRRRRRLSRAVIHGPECVQRLMRPLLERLDREFFYAILLTTKHDVIAIELITIGSLSASLVHPREVFKPAVLQSAAAIIAVHNHPSGDPTPSREDEAFTRRLAGAGEVLGIRLLDHVILGDDCYESLKSQGVF